MLQIPAYKYTPREILKMSKRNTRRVGWAWKLITPNWGWSEDKLTNKVDEEKWLQMWQVNRVKDKTNWEVIDATK